MKISLKMIAVSGLSLVPLNNALAIEPPPDDARPPAVLPDTRIELEFDKPAPEAQQQVLPFIGLATATLPEMVADHLDIENGSGVIVRTVSPESPADKAGLTVNDVILKIGGTAVGSPEAVTAVIRDHAVGDRVALELIHKGKPSKVEVQLVERPANLAAQLDQEPLLDGIPEVQADRLRDLLKNNLGAFGQGGAVFPDAQIEDKLRMMREQMNEALGGNPGADGGINLQHRSTIRVMDDKGSIEIRKSGESTEVTVSDANNEIVWTGPWDTDQDKAAAPEDIRERIEKVKFGKGPGIQLRLGKPGFVPDAIEN